MIEPNGPLPQYVYWRRRAVAAGASVLAVVLLAWLIGGLVEADDQHPVHGTASSSALGGGATSASARAESTPASAPPSSPGPTDPRGSSTASPRAGASPSPTTRPTTQAPPPPPPGPPGPCPDQAIQVSAVPDQPSYRVGARPLLRLRVTNVGPHPCTRDVSRQLREILVLGMDGARLWSSNDCYGPLRQDVRVLPVNQPVEFSVNWAGRTSAPGCPVDRKTVLAGTYQVVGRLGNLTSPPAPLTMV